MEIRFGSFVLDLNTRQLTRGHAEVHLTPKAFDLLAALVEARPRVLPKPALLDRLWPGTFVAEANLSNLVAEIRAALDDTAREPRWIRTAHAVGYSFCGEVVPRRAAERRDPGGPRCWLEWGARRFPLPAGTHVVGRDPDVEVRLVAPTVSRRHARLIITRERASLEDLGSKNGTRRGGRRVVSAIQLADGDDIHIGSVLVTFHLRSRVTTTATATRPPADSD